MQKTILSRVLGQVLRPVLNTRYFTDPGVGGGGWTPQPGDYLLNETGLFLTDESGNQLTA